MSQPLTQKYKSPGGEFDIAMSTEEETSKESVLYECSFEPLYILLDDPTFDLEDVNVRFSSNMYTYFVG